MEVKIVKDPLGRKALIAEKRLSKPSEYRGEIEKCPFCPGSEEIERNKIYENEDKSVVVIPNKYPMSPHNYVIVHKNHDDGFHNPKYLDELSDAAKFLFNLAKRYSKDVFIFKNHGYLSGASLSHSHEQGFFIDVLIENEEELADYIKEHISSLEYRITDYSFAPKVSIKPYEVWVMLEGNNLLNAKGWHRVSTIFNALLKTIGKKFDYNAFVYYSNKGLFPPFVVILPRLEIIGGVELMQSLFVNPLNPKIAANKIRENL